MNPRDGAAVNAGPRRDGKKYPYIDPW